MSNCNSYFAKGNGYYSKQTSIKKTENFWNQYKNTACEEIMDYSINRSIVESSSKRNYSNNLEDQFKVYVQNWKNETRGYSTFLHKARNDNFLDIIGIGKPAIKLILDDLSKQPSFLFIALKHLVKIHMNESSPIKKEEIGNVKKMITSWLNWGKERNIIK